MSIEKEIRDYFGWSQETLAFYLDVSRSLINLVEKGERSLPIGTGANIKLVQLEFFMQGKDASNQPLPPAEPANLPPEIPTAKKLQRFANRYEMLADNTRQQLADAQRRCEQAQHSLALHQYLAPTVAAATGEAAKKDSLWLEGVEAAAKKAFKQFGLEAQAVLQWKRDCYLYAAERAKELAQ